MSSMPFSDVRDATRAVPAAREAPGLAARALLVALGAYRMALAPLMGGTCRFTPSCSAYAEEAVRAHGAGRGGWLTLRRLARCHPFGGWGHDPVPPAAPRPGR